MIVIAEYPVGYDDKVVAHGANNYEHYRLCVYVHGNLPYIR